MRLLLLGLLAVGVATPAAGDTVWLRNGRVLQVEDARIDKDTVVFRTHGVVVTMPADFVRQIRRDDGRSPLMPPRAPERRRPTPESLRPLAPDARTLRTPRPGAATTSPQPASFFFDPRDRSYWQDKMSWIHDQISRLEARSVGTRNRGRVRTGGRYGDLASSHRELLAWRALETALRAEARSLGVPSAWLRVGNRLGD